MRVLWIGAGASIAGGYPSALRLIPEMERDATEGVVEGGARTEWEVFAGFREAARGTERTLLFSPNPEVVLSVPDLFEAALAADDDRIHSEFEAPAIRALLDQRAGRIPEAREASISPDQIEHQYARAERERLTEAKRARDSLLHVLDQYFGSRHYYDGAEEGVARRAYLRRELNDLEEGDVIITTNWDTMIERTLLEDGRWSPADGYGFPASLTPVPPEVRSILKRGLDWTAPLPAWPDWAPRRSTVRVLKIHGSFGWRAPNRFGPRVETPGQVYLDHGQFRSAMPFIRRGSIPDARSNELCLLWDESEPESYDPSNRPVYMYPSYLKQIVGSTLQDIWHEADVALRNATELRVLGASLPDADGAVRVLLNSVRRRVSDGTIGVMIDDPSETTLARWRDFLGSSIATRRRKAGAEIDSPRAG